MYEGDHQAFMGKVPAYHLSECIELELQPLPFRDVSATWDCFYMQIDGYSTGMSCRADRRTVLFYIRLLGFDSCLFERGQFG